MPGSSATIFTSFSESLTSTRGQLPDKPNRAGISSSKLRAKSSNIRFISRWRAKNGLLSCADLGAATERLRPQGTRSVKAMVTLLGAIQVQFAANAGQELPKGPVASA